MLCENTANIGQNPTRHLIGAIREAAIVEAFYSSIKPLRDFPAFLTATATTGESDSSNSTCPNKNFCSGFHPCAYASATLGTMATGCLLSVAIYRSVVTQGYTQSKIPHIQRWRRKMRAPIHTDSGDVTKEHKGLNINDPDLRLCVCSSFTGDLYH